MKIFSTLLACLLLFSYNINAQHTKWLKLSDSTFARDFSNAVAYDNNGNTYSTGSYAGILKIGSYRDTSTAGVNDDGNSTPMNGYVAKFDVSGNLLWVKTLKGNGEKRCYDIELNKTTGECYVSGVFENELKLDGVLLNTDTLGNYRSFLIKFNSSGNKIWADFGSSNFDADGGYSIALSPVSNDIYWHVNFIDKYYFNSTLLVNGGPFDRPGASGQILHRINTNNGTLKSSKYGADYIHDGYLLTCDNAGKVLWAGSDRYVGYTVLNPEYSLPEGFIMKLSANLADTVWITQVSGTAFQTVTSIAVDSLNNVYFTGGFQDSAAFYTNPNYSSPFSGSKAYTLYEDAQHSDNDYVAKLSSGGVFRWAKKFYGNHLVNVAVAPEDAETPLAADNAGNVYIGGSFDDTLQYDGSTVLTHNHLHKESYLLKLNNAGGFKWAIQPSTLRGGLMHGLAVSMRNNAVYTSGELRGIYNIYADNYFSFEGDSVNTDYSASYVWVLQDCDKIITAQTTAVRVDGAHPAILSVPAVAGATYQWYKNGNPISGATSNTYNATSKGSYYCVIDDGVCTLTSTTVKLKPFTEALFAADGENIKSNTDKQVVSVYPNPASKFFVLNFANASPNQIWCMQLTDAQGRIVLEKNISGSKQLIELPAGIAKGNYFIKAITGKENYTMPVIVQ